MNSFGRHTFFIALAVAAAGCGSNDDTSGTDTQPDLCQAAVEHLQQCFPERDIAAPASCDTEESAAIVDLSCDELQAGAGKADWPWCTPWTWWLCGDTGGSEVLVSGLLHPHRLDPDGSYVYWTTTGSGNDTQGTVERTRKDGSGNVELLFEGAQPREIAVDVSHVYWTMREDDGSHTLNRVPVAGGTREQLATAGNQIAALALDDDHVYCALDDELVRMDKSDSSTLVLAPVKSVVRVIPDGGNLYWKNTFGVGPINRVPIDGGEVETLVEEAWTTTFALTDDAIYWVNDDTIMRTPKEGGTAEAVFDTDQIGVPDMLVADGSIYFLDLHGERLRKVGLDGSGEETLATAQESPKRLSQDDTHVYWVNDGTTTSMLNYLEDGNIRSLEK